MKNPYKLIYVEWQDAFSNATWFREEELKEWWENEIWVQQTGWIIHEDKRRITLATRLTWDSFEKVWRYGMLQNIPKTWIRKRVAYRIASSY